MAESHRAFVMFAAFRNAPFKNGGRNCQQLNVRRGDVKKHTNSVFIFGTTLYGNCEKKREFPGLFSMLDVSFRPYCNSASIFQGHLCKVILVLLMYGHVAPVFWMFIEGK